MHQKTIYELESCTTWSFDRKKYAYETSSKLGFQLQPDPQVALDKRVWRKLDLWLLPTVAMFYLLSFLVRIIVNTEEMWRTDVCRIELTWPTLE